ncbi:MAG: BamA/TamA family outer membrane protein [Chitinophagaceae bacterium]|nr:BamA/TamA family outer membrane protein [Chitinophagaceae bacterium]
MQKKCLIVACLFPLALMGQKAPNTLPQNNEVKDTARQTDLIDVAKGLFKIKSKPVREEKEKRIYFSFLPISSNPPGGSGNALVTSTTAGIYLGSRRTTNKSTATFAPYWNLKKRFGLPLRTNVWLPGNTWNIVGDIRFLVYPQYTWGIGSSNDYDERTLVDYRYIRFYQVALKRIKPYFYGGLGYHIDYRFNIDSDNPALPLKQFTGYPYGTGNNSYSSGLSLNLLYDTRNNDINPLPGSYANIVYRMNPNFLGNTNYWHSLYLDARKYVPLNPARRNQQNVLAFWSYYWTMLDNGAPYLDLPSTGWDPYNRSARGIDQNRHRGKSLFYLETEYRRDITRNGLFGFVLFTNVNTVSGTGTMFTSWNPAAGAGLRIKFNKGNNTNIGIDYGFSKSFSNIIVNISEAF